MGIYEACIDRIGRDYGTVGDSTSVKTLWPEMHDVIIYAGFYGIAITSLD